MGLMNTPPTCNMHPATSEKKLKIIVYLSKAIAYDISFDKYLYINILITSA